MKSVILILAFAVAVYAQVPSVQWQQQRAEILRHHRSLVQIDTSNPPGNETKAAEYLKKVFDAEGIPSQIFALDPSRANIVARLKGNGNKRPLLILAHTDVVGVQREKWPMDPFGAVLKDGFIWGRGSVDDKDKLTANLMVMLLLKRNQAKLDRDVIFLAESGEEGTTGPGIDFMVNQHFDAINAEFAMTEGGGATIDNGHVTTVQIQTTEKVPRGTRLVVNGTSGHGSVPRLDNAVVHLAAAVGKVGTWETPMRLNDTTRTYFEKLAAISPPDKAARYNALLDPKRTEEAQRYLREREPQRYSMLRTSIVPTILKGGFRVNVIPSEAEATLDVRALPDEDLDKLYAEMRKVIGDPAVKIERIPGNDRPVGAPSRLDTDMYRALEQVSKRVYPGAMVLPIMGTGASDMAQLRAKGVQCYGIGPARTEEDSTNYGAHSDVERIPEASLYQFVEFTWNAVAAVAAAK
ncbi:MAG: M20/M25/M40 family metallo-hydrolase [Bryobacterales bacterium]|nr:M20/M25/M40 family metallo-hydrolase [Bryobacterales bacterium]MBV9400428.1 M20/M25/M40 family metallo-hydrolase [Bryobacterales bacterium]